MHECRLSTNLAALTRPFIPCSRLLNPRPPTARFPLLAPLPPLLLSSATSLSPTPRTYSVFDLSFVRYLQPTPHPYSSFHLTRSLALHRQSSPFISVLFTANTIFKSHYLLSSSITSRHLRTRQFTTQPSEQLKKGSKEMEKHTVIENLDLQTHDSNSSTAGGQSGKGFVEDGSNSSQTTEKKPSKLRQLIRNYGRIVIAAYILISVVDYSLCVWAVRFGGEELVKYIDDTLGAYIPALKRAANKMSTATSEQQAAEVPDANWWTILIVGYILHKVLMPVRLGITAAVTPYLARRAQKMGWSWLVSKRSILKERHMH